MAVIPFPSESCSITIRFHGRGGQGAVTSAELLALAAIADGRCAQAFPSFGPERRGAPVLAFARVSDSVIRNRSAVREPDVVVVLDPSLIKLIPVEQGLSPGGTVVVNTARTPEDIRTLSGIGARLAVVDANRIAREEIGRTITNTAMLGALLSAVPIVPEARMETELLSRFGPSAVRNIAAFRRARRECVIADAVFSGRSALNPRSARPNWTELAVGSAITEPGSARAHRTGDWRTSRPVGKREHCVRCGVCVIFCPEGCIAFRAGEEFPAVDLFYCKGCGICAHECPTGCISMVDEEE